MKLRYFAVIYCSLALILYLPPPSFFESSRQLKLFRIWLVYLISSSSKSRKFYYLLWLSERQEIAEIPHCLNYII